MKGCTLQNNFNHTAPFCGEWNSTILSGSLPPNSGGSSCVINLIKDEVHTVNGNTPRGITITSDTTKDGVFCTMDANGCPFAVDREIERGVNRMKAITKHGTCHMAYATSGGRTCDDSYDRSTRNYHDEEDEEWYEEDEEEGEDSPRIHIIDEHRDGRLLGNILCGMSRAGERISQGLDMLSPLEKRKSGGCAAIESVDYNNTRRRGGGGAETQKGLFQNYYNTGRGRWASRNHCRTNGWDESVSVESCFSHTYNQQWRGREPDYAMREAHAALDGRSFCEGTYLSSTKLSERKKRVALSGSRVCRDAGKVIVQDNCPYDHKKRHKGRRQCQSPFGEEKIRANDPFDSPKNAITHIKKAGSAGSDDNDSCNPHSKSPGLTGSGSRCSQKETAGRSAEQRNGSGKAASPKTSPHKDELKEKESTVVKKEKVSCGCFGGSREKR